MDPSLYMTYMHRLIFVSHLIGTGGHRHELGDVAFPYKKERSRFSQGF